MNTFTYYNYSRLLSYKATYNIAVGGRGTGKTYGAKKLTIKKAIKNGEQFIYLRRYKDELKLARNTFFADVQNEFPDTDFRIHGNEAQMSPASEKDNKKREWQTIGYFIALSVAQSFKSVAFPLVTTIIFDEFILEKSATHYLPDESVIFNNFYSTVDRYKDKTKVFFLANSVSITNPYFMAYKIEPKNADKNGFIKMAEGFMVCHFIESKEFESEVYQTVFGKFIKGTEYADYAVGNQFSDNHDALIADKTSNAKYLFTLEVGQSTFSVWYDVSTGEYNCKAKRPKNENVYTLIPERMAEDKTLIEHSSKTLSALRTAYRHARVTFDRPATRNGFLEIFKR